MTVTFCYSFDRKFRSIHYANHFMMEFYCERISDYKQA